jgi:peptide chain release factor 2
MAESGFWENSAESNKLMQELKALKGVVEPLNSSEKRIADALEFLELAGQDEEILKQLTDETVSLAETIGKLELQTRLSGEYDRNNAILSINAGAGGTESCDWASMLLRMYLRWAEIHGYETQELDILPGEEAGIKNVTIRIAGDCVYGFLKAEKGVHRLVRISPFDSNKRRHTSFVSVEIIPEINDDIAVDINPVDLRIDVFRSSGPGGQSVNTTDSAVRITHLPSGFVVQSQNERSQLQNRMQCMRVLRAKLHERMRREQEDRMSKEAGEKQKIEWGSQIRSYVLHPYNMIKDHRTDYEVGNTAKVLDGDIDQFIEAYLKLKPEDRDKKSKDRDKE